MITEQDIVVTSKQQGVVAGEMMASHPKLHHLKNNALVVLADGVDNFFDFLQSEMPSPEQEGASSGEGWGDFNAFKSYEEAIDTFQNKPETIVEFDPGELRITDDQEVGNQVDYDVVGDYIDMGRFMEGVPESWGSMHNGNARNRRANLWVDVSAAGFISHQDITRRGERILRLVDALEAGGVRTQLIAVESTKCSHTEIVLKSHHEPLTITDLAVVSHPEFLRRALFRVSEYSKTWDYGYGSSTSLQHAISRFPEVLHPESNDEVSIYIGNNMSYSLTKNFDKLENLLQWELSKPVPEVDAIRITDNGIDFKPNGYRAEAEIKREGLEVIDV